MLIQRVDVSKSLALQVATMLPENRKEAECVLWHTHSLLGWRHCPQLSLVTTATETGPPPVRSGSNKWIALCAGAMLFVMGWLAEDPVSATMHWRAAAGPVACAVGGHG